MGLGPAQLGVPNKPALRLEFEDTGLPIAQWNGKAAIFQIFAVFHTLSDWGRGPRGFFDFMFPRDNYMEI